MCLLYLIGSIFSVSITEHHDESYDVLHCLRKVTVTTDACRSKERDSIRRYGIWETHFPSPQQAELLLPKKYDGLQYEKIITGTHGRIQRLQIERQEMRVAFVAQEKQERIVPSIGAQQPARW